MNEKNIEKHVAEYPLIAVSELNVEETHFRSLAKGVGWRALATLTTILLVFAFTGKLALALEVGGLEVIAKIALYYAYERIWNSITWGRLTSVPSKANV